MPPKPPVLASLFKSATLACPSEITGYATCVTSHYDSDKLAKGVCEKEFQALNKCFKKVRLQGRR